MLKLPVFWAVSGYICGFGSALPIPPLPVKGRYSNRVVLILFIIRNAKEVPVAIIHTSLHVEHAGGAAMGSEGYQ